MALTDFHREFDIERLTRDSDAPDNQAHKIQRIKTILDGVLRKNDILSINKSIKKLMFGDSSDLPRYLSAQNFKNLY